MVKITVSESNSKNLNVAYIYNSITRYLSICGADADITFYRGEGCPECRHTGFHGRRAVFEILTVNDKLRRLISQGADYDALLKAAADTDFTSMRDNCRALVLSGETTAAEAARAIHSTID